MNSIEQNIGPNPSPSQTESVPIDGEHLSCIDSMMTLIRVVDDPSQLMPDFGLSKKDARDTSQFQVKPGTLVSTAQPPKFPVRLIDDRRWSGKNGLALKCSTLIYGTKSDDATGHRQDNIFNNPSYLLALKNGDLNNLRKVFVANYRTTNIWLGKRRPFCSVQALEQKLSEMNNRRIGKMIDHSSKYLIKELLVQLEYPMLEERSFLWQNIKSFLLKKYQENENIREKIDSLKNTFEKIDLLATQGKSESYFHRAFKEPPKLRYGDMRYLSHNEVLCLLTPNLIEAVYVNPVMTHIKDVFSIRSTLKKHIPGRSFSFFTYHWLEGYCEISEEQMKKLKMFSDIATDSNQGPDVLRFKLESEFAQLSQDPSGSSEIWLLLKLAASFLNREAFLMLLDINFIPARGVETLYDIATRAANSDVSSYLFSQLDSNTQAKIARDGFDIQGIFSSRGSEWIRWVEKFNVPHDLQGYDGRSMGWWVSKDNQEATAAIKLLSSWDFRGGSSENREFILACKSGEIEKAIKLAKVEAGRRVELLEQSLMFFAFKLRQLDALQLLLETGIPTSLCNFQGKTLLHILLTQPLLSVMLFDHNKDSETQKLQALEKKFYSSTLAMLINFGGDLNSKDVFSETPISYAFKNVANSPYAITAKEIIFLRWLINAGGKIDFSKFTYEQEQRLMRAGW